MIKSHVSKHVLYLHGKIFNFDMVSHDNYSSYRYQKELVFKYN